MRTYTPTQQQYKDEQKRSRKARELVKQEKVDDSFYQGKSSLKEEGEINSYMEIK